MIANLFADFKKGVPHKKPTLQRRLVYFFAGATVLLVLLFALLLVLFGITGKEEKTVHAYFDTELENISGAVYRDFGRLSVDGIDLAERISDSCDTFFSQNGIAAEELRDHPDLIEPLLDGQLQRLLTTLNSHTCGGVFLLLDATVRPEAEGADLMRAGLFIKKTQPSSTQAVGVKMHCLRGPARIARAHGVELLGQWTMEYDITDERFFLDVMETARKNQALPLSRLYYWTGRVTLKGNSEAGFLLCVPLRSREGEVFGVCGIEVSDRMFKQLYSPGGSYEQLFAAAAPQEGATLCTSRGMIAGNYYLTGSRMTEDLQSSSARAAFEQFAGADDTYGGKSTALRLYPHGSPYEDESWAVAVLMPAEPLCDAVNGQADRLYWIICGLLVLSLVLSVLISHHYLHPVTKALDSIRSNTYEKAPDSTYLEIADLFDFLATKDKEHETERQTLQQQRLNAEAHAASAQTELSRLADRRQREVDPEEYALFRSSLSTLTPKEREVFGLYLEGKSAKEIVTILGFSDNTLKYHNKHIYEKLGVSSRKELLLYAALMKQENERKKGG